MDSKRVVVNTLSGIGLGFLTGLLLGLAVHQVVGAFLSVIAALLASYFGLSQKSENSDQSDTVRIAAFGLACSGAVLVGITIRTHELLSPSISDQILALTNAQYSAAEARSLVAFKNLGIVPKDTTIAQPAVSSLSSGLFGVQDSSECTHLSAARFSTVQTRLDAMRNAGGLWQELAGSLQGVAAEKATQVVEASYRLKCG